MLTLIPSVLPIDSVNEFEVCFQSISEDLINNKFSLEMLTKAIGELSSKPDDILKSSIPTL